MLGNFACFFIICTFIKYKNNLKTSPGIIADHQYQFGPRSDPGLVSVQLQRLSADNKSCHCARRALSYETMTFHCQVKQVLAFDKKAPSTICIKSKDDLDHQLYFEVLEAQEVKRVREQKCHNKIHGCHVNSQNHDNQLPSS